MYKSSHLLISNCCKSKWLFITKRNLYIQSPMYSKRDINKFIKSLGDKFNKDQIETMLSENEEHVSVDKVVKNCPIKEVFINQLGANTKIEDRWQIGVNQVQGEVSSLLASVVDGHAGRDCAQIVNKAGLEYLAASFLNPTKLEQCLKDMEEIPNYKIVRSFHPGYWESLNDSVKLQFKQSLNDYMNDLLKNQSRNVKPEYVMKEALTRLDQDMCIPKDEENLQKWFSSRPLARASLSGAVGLFIRVYWLGEEGYDHPTLHVANVGDCGGMLAKYDSEVEKVIATPLSKPHNCFNTNELDRIHSQHQNDDRKDLFRDSRLLGELACTRAFGDVRYKWPAKWLKQLYSSFKMTDSIHATPTPYRDPPYLTAEPDVYKYKLDDSVRFAVLATDGLWDMMSYEKACEIVLKCPADCSPATQLLKNALIGSKSFNDNLISEQYESPMDIKSLSMHLALPRGTARYFRDDITIMVLKF